VRCELIEKSAKVAIVGCGRISGHHCRSIIRTEGVELSAVCDLDLAKAEAYRAEFGTKAYSDYRKMLDENPDINVVAIVTPSGMHYEHAIDILQNYRKNIVVEKPTFMRPSQVNEAYSLATSLGLQIFPVFQNRHNLAVQRVKRGVISGELGEIRTLSIRVRWCRPQRYYDLAPWRGTFAMDGGCLTNQGIHHIDLMRYLGGELEKVSAVMRTRGAQIEVEDTMVGAALFANGAVGSIEVTTAARPIDYEASISLVCAKGLAQIGGIAVNELQVYSPDPDSCRLNSEDFSGNVYGHGHEKLYQGVADFFTKGIPFPVTHSDTLGTISLLNAFYISDEHGTYADATTSEDSCRLGKADESLSSLYRTPQAS
jgi:UDP-N-acetyl-2-amino-2-deoxyglucuronate dehydrogenase